MRLVLVTIPVAVLVGYLAGGRLGRLAHAPVRWRSLALAGIALQFAPVSGAPGVVVLLASFALLLTFAGANTRLPGLPLVLLGLLLNSVVIGANQGMPVTRDALVASGQRDTLGDLIERPGAKHHLATSEDVLLPLADAIPIGYPIRQAVSAGDLFVHVGAMLFVVSGMRRRAPLPSPADPITRATSGGGSGG